MIPENCLRQFRDLKGILMDENNLFKNTDTVTEFDLKPYMPGASELSSDYRNRLAEKSPRISGPARFFICSLIAAAAAFSAVCLFTETFSINTGYFSAKTKTSVLLGINSKPVPENMSDGNGRYTPAGLAKEVSPSIVEIYSKSDISMKSVVGTGSGIIMSEDGYIVTNAHVITSGKHTSVSLNSDDKTLYDAEVIGYDSKTDLAVIKIDPGTVKLHPAVFGNSDETVQGEQVAAIGNPGGLSNSISVGYISAVKRPIQSGSTSFVMECLQTDAAISPGNSGGALVNMYGQVIGITSSKYVGSSSGYLNPAGEGFEGIGFAISINAAKPIIEELTANGYVSGRYRIGITFTGITDEISEQTGYHKGLLISSFDENCDIASSGIQENDIMYEVEGHEVCDYTDLVDLLKEKNKGAGDTVHAKIYRKDDDGNEQYIDIEFKLMPDTSGDY